MARLYKLQCYIADYNDSCKNSEDLINKLKETLDRFDMGIMLFPDIDESKSFEWNDDIDLNNNCSKYDCEKYFKPVYFEENDWFEEDDLEWIEQILEELKFNGVLDNMKINDVKYLLGELRDLYMWYDYKINEMCFNDADTYYDFIEERSHIKELIDYLMMFYKEELNLTEHEKACFSV